MRFCRCRTPGYASANDTWIVRDGQELDRQDSATSTFTVEENDAYHALVQQDINEINDKCHDVHAGFWAAGATISVWVAMEPSRFLLDRERSLAWGIQPDLLVCFEMKFDRFYTHSAYVSSLVV